jgi:secreted Zn-dependent insulinase-like peptidase
MRQYYAKYYGAQNLKLVAYGGIPLDQLESTIRGCFGSIKRAPANGPAFGKNGFPFTGLPLSAC